MFRPYTAIISCFYLLKLFHFVKQTETPDDVRVRPKHVEEREGDNKRVELWAEVKCVNEKYINGTGCLNTIICKFITFEQFVIFLPTRSSFTFNYLLHNYFYPRSNVSEHFNNICLASSSSISLYIYISIVRSLLSLRNFSLLQ
jgi:hypothetical protein